jgi:GGDEF domain-containing protein
VNRPTDLIGRWAGGQFAILLPETGADGASTVAQRVIAAAADLPLARADPADKTRFTLCVGGGYRESSRSPARARPPGEGLPNDLIQAAGHALKRAAAAGGSSYRLIDLAHPVGPGTALQDPAIAR